MLRTEQVMTREDEARVTAAIGELAEPLEKDQIVELAGIVFRVVHP